MPRGYAREDGMAPQRATLGGIDFAQARYYDSLIGRFMSADTIVPNPNDPQAFNRYSYGLNNPLRYVDPSGHCILPETGLLGSLAEIFCPGQEPKPTPAIDNPPGSFKATVEALATQSSDVRQPTATATLMPSATPTEPVVDVWPTPTSTPAVTPRPGMITAQGSGSGPTPTVDPNAVGQWAVSAVVNNLPITGGSFVIRNPQTGKIERVYDGQFNGSGQYVEIKGSATGRRVSLDGRIQQEIEYDGQQANKPLWIFVNTQPTKGVQQLLNKYKIPWHELHVPDYPH